MSHKIFPLIEKFPLGTDVKNLRFLLLGTCAVGPLIQTTNDNSFNVDHLLWESYSHSQTPPVKENNFDAHIVSLTLRHILADATFELASLSNNDIYWPRIVASGRITEYLEICNTFIEKKVKDIAHLFEVRPTFFLSFLEPKHNYFGNLFPRYKITNPAYFIQKLNEHLFEVISEYRNAYFIDSNEIVSLAGNMHVRDDYVHHIAHASYMSDFDVSYDKSRLQKSTSPTQMYDTEVNLRYFGNYLWKRISDNLKIIQQSNPVKLIITDLDDTLWRGVAADEDRPIWEFTEGWPLGFAEALLIFKARGGMLAICSKNDYESTVKRLDSIYAGRITLNDFVSIKINFERKSQNISEILQEVNVLAGNTLFIDDNPREIDEVISIHPQIRTLSAEHYDWRRIILTSPETQVPILSKESTSRTELIKAKIDREKSKSSDNREEWLESLKLEQIHRLIDNTADHNFDRAFELLNKTNQFNTTGKRWLISEVENLFLNGGYFLCSFLRDRTIDNGLVGLTIISNNEIMQAILSCRVFGLSSEYASGHAAVSLILRNHDYATAQIVDTGKNFTCHDYFKNMNFTELDGKFFSTKALPQPETLRNNFEENGKLEVIHIPAISSGMAGDQVEIQCRIYNESNTVWISDKFPINMSYRLFDANGGLPVSDGLRTGPLKTLAPSDYVDVTVSVLLPEQHGNYMLQLCPVHESRKWFDLEKFSSNLIRLTIY